MSLEKDAVKEGFKKAFMQMQSGCGNQFCLNPYCKVNLIDVQTPTEISIRLLELSKMALGHNLANSKEFIFCEQGKKVCLRVSEDLTGPEIIEIFSDPVSLGSSFRSVSGNDWEMIELLYKKIEFLCFNGILDLSWLFEQCLRNWKVTAYSILFIPYAMLIVLGYTGSGDNIIVNYSSFLLSTRNLFSEFSLLADRYPVNIMKSLIGKIKKVISDKFKEDIEDVEFDCFLNELDLLQTLYMSNERVLRVPFEEFYIEAINTEVNLKVDFKYWYSQINTQSGLLKKSSFFWYPWTYNASSKSVMLSQEIRELMLTEIHNAWLDADLEVYTKLEVNRNSILEDTLLQLNSGINLKKPLKIHFIGEEGVDEGGVKKEFFQLIIKQIFDPNFGMFIHYEDQRRVWFNPDTFDSGVNFEVVGRIVGLAIYNSTILDIHLPMAAYKKLLGQPVNILDLEEFNPDLVKGLKSLLEFQGNVEEVFLQYFTIETSAFGHSIQHDLIPNGSQIPVTNQNREMFINLYIDWWLNKGIQLSFEGFKKGFLSICNGQVLKQFKAAELELVVCGNPKLDFFALENSTKYEGFTRESSTIRYFWEIIHGFDGTQQKKFLCFVSGSDRAPIGGLGKMQMTISRTGGDVERLMTAHTCFNYLILPEYKDKARMRLLMITAIENASGFGLR